MEGKITTRTDLDAVKRVYAAAVAFRRERDAARPAIDRLVAAGYPSAGAAQCGWLNDELNPLDAFIDDLRRVLAGEPGPLDRA